jgi:GNAT superfamily N-acetyltransferase
MPLPEFIERFLDYRKRHGFGATLRRIGLSLQRAGTGHWFVLYSCDPGSFRREKADDLNGGKVERRNAPGALSAQEMAEIGSNWKSTLDKRRLTERFEQGASLWLFKVEGKIAGYGWTMVGRTVEPHYFPLGANDVHLFDFFVFPEFRGRRINPMLVNCILNQAALEKNARAFIEAAVWNRPQLASLGRTPFKPIGQAWKCRVFGRTLVVWSRKDLTRA